MSVYEHEVHLPEDIDLVVFDFDLTLTKKHTGGSVSGRKGELTEDAVRYNFADLPFLQKLLPALVQSGRRVAVATFSDALMAARSGDRTAIAGASLIEHYMDIAFGPQRTFLKSSIGDIEAWYPPLHDKDQHQIGKNEHVENLMQRLGVEDPSRVLLFDDDQKNCELSYVRAVHIDTAGFTRRVWEQKPWNAPLSPRTHTGCSAVPPASAKRG